ncbi:SpoIIE family protein phosphatase [Streptomyces sp. CB00455]|uniref:SpoIIE family protein phosphatase n=1 Tax=Streptomyces sp. CB00455 TaxID=1703927 RepID=UPI0009A0AD0C|nr:SpoIIE family protein phosphatase [Streptomyces sp. CB00455]
MLYLTGPGERVLHLVLVGGVSREFAAPWSRVGPDDPVPVAVAVREGRLVWLGSQEEMARLYPRVGLVLPYDFTLAAAPVPGSALPGSPAKAAPTGTATAGTGTTDTASPAPTDTGAAATAAAGGLVLLWSGSHPPYLDQREKDAIGAGCRSLAQVLRQAADEGHAVQPLPAPAVLRPPPPPTPGPVEAAAVLAFVRRLPGASCALDLNGRITFATPEAAGLLGAPLSRLIGALPWEALPWMDTPAVEDHYRGAVISRLPRSFTALRPPDHPVRFELYPDDSGISVRMGPGDDLTEADADRAAGGSPPPAPVPSRATALYQLMHLAAGLTEAAHAHDVVEQAADQLVPALGAQAMALFVVEEGRLHIVGHRGYPDELAARFDGRPLTDEGAGTGVLRTGRPMFFADREEVRAAYPDADIEQGMAAWAVLPLIASGRPVGTLILGYSRPHPFAPGERAILTSIAGLIAQALDRARLYDTTHQLAHSLQTSLLPHVLPDVPGLEVAARYLPAAHGLDVGGDFYDLIRIDDTTVAATIGDVQGHNVNAAALMGQVRTAVHAVAGAPPGEVLARTNRLLTDLDPGLFTSCLYVHIDLARHSACLATAGHPPPLLRHPDGPVDVLRLRPGLLLGIDPGATYTATEIPFTPGTLLALYTDGLVESPGRDIDDTIDATAAHLAVTHDRPLEPLADELIRHARRASPRHDDIALLLLRSRQALP